MQALLICVEVHGMKSASMVRELSGKLVGFRHRHGLSATPERECDEEVTAFMEREIEPVVFRFGFAEAIRKGILCGSTTWNSATSSGTRTGPRPATPISDYHAKRKAGQKPGIRNMCRAIAAVAKTTRSKLPAGVRGPLHAAARINIRRGMEWAGRGADHLLRASDPVADNAPVLVRRKGRSSVAG